MNCSEAGSLWMGDAQLCLKDKKGLCGERWYLQYFLNSLRICVIFGCIS